MPECQSDPIKRCLLLNNMGIYHRKNRDPEKAVRFYEQALQECSASWLRGRIFANWGVLEHHRGNLVAARRLYQDALNCCSQPVEDEKAVARLCINFARLHIQQDRTVQAETLLRRARGLVARYPDDAMLECRLYLALGRAAMAGKRLSKAEVDFTQAIRVVQKLDYFEPVMLAQTRAALADCYSIQAFAQMDGLGAKNEGRERVDEADNLFSEAIDLLEDAEQRHSSEYLETLSLAVDHSVRTGCWETAEERVQKLLELVTATEQLEFGIRISAWERATQILRQVGKTELAERAQRRYTRLLAEQREKALVKPPEEVSQPVEAAKLAAGIDSGPARCAELAKKAPERLEEPPAAAPRDLRGPARAAVLRKPAAASAEKSEAPKARLPRQGPAGDRENLTES